jgi:chemotaxis protein MotB
MHRGHRSDPINPYIALADVYMNLGVAFVILAMLFMFLGNRGWEDVRYRRYLQDFERAVLNEPDLAGRVAFCNRNDAPGEQRWMFPNAVLFRGDTATLTPDGRRVLNRFAALLRQNRHLWWRIRVEAHSRQDTYDTGPAAERRALTLTSMRAVAVALHLHYAGDIEPYRIVASGRGYQDQYDRNEPWSLKNDRVDILLLPRSIGGQLK